MTHDLEQAFGKDTGALVDQAVDHAVDHAVDVPLCTDDTLAVALFGKDVHQRRAWLVFVPRSQLESFEAALVALHFDASTAVLGAVSAAALDYIDRDVFASGRTVPFEEAFAPYQTEEARRAHEVQVVTEHIRRMKELVELAGTVSDLETSFVEKCTGFKKPWHKRETSQVTPYLAYNEVCGRTIRIDDVTPDVWENLPVMTLVLDSCTPEVTSSFFDKKQFASFQELKDKVDACIVLYRPHARTNQCGEEDRSRVEGWLHMSYDVIPGDEHVVPFEEIKAHAARWLCQDPHDDRFSCRLMDYMEGCGFRVRRIENDWGLREMFLCGIKPRQQQSLMDMTLEELTKMREQELLQPLPPAVAVLFDSLEGNPFERCTF